LLMVYPVSAEIFFDDDFESGAQSFDSSWYGSLLGHQYYTIEPDPLDSSNHVVRYFHEQGISGSAGRDYVVQHIGDSTKDPIHSDMQGQSIDDLYVQWKLMWSEGYDWSAGNNKIMIIGTEDGQRHEMCCNPWVSHYITILVGGSGNNGYFDAEGNNKNTAAHEWYGIDPNVGSGSSPINIETGRWYTVEFHKQLNDVGVANGIYEFWIDSEKVAEKGRRIR